MLGLLLAASLLAAGPPESAQVKAALDRAIVAFASHRGALERKFGATQTVDLGVRLVSDEANLAGPAPSGLTENTWHEDRLAIAREDLEMLSRAITWPQPKIQNETGLHAGFVQSPSDGLWEPLAVYVPARHAEHPPIAIVIHGRPQTEMELLAPPPFRALADSTGTILVAPWGRAVYDFKGVAGSDVIAPSDRLSSPR